MANLSFTSKELRSIEVLIRKWSTKLTWSLLVTSIEIELGITTTRQTLCTYKAIKNEYDSKKSELRGASPELLKQVTKADVDLAGKYKKLKAENEILKKHNAEQLRFIERIFANASELPFININELAKTRSEETKSR